MSDEDRCVICDDPSSTQRDQILYCDGKDCDIPVHQSCYGVPVIPEDDWFCEKCAALRNNIPVTTVCCSTKTGAFKSTTVQGEFMHVVCALYNKSVDKRTPPYKFDRNRMHTQKCYICKQRQGLVVKCESQNCPRVYHVTCGINAGLITPSKIIPTNLAHYCLEHMPKSQRSNPASASKEASKKSQMPPAKRPLIVLTDSSKSTILQPAHRAPPTTGDGVRIEQVVKKVKVPSSHPSTSTPSAAAGLSAATQQPGSRNLSPRTSPSLRPATLPPQASTAHDDDNDATTAATTTNSNDNNNNSSSSRNATRLISRDLMVQSEINYLKTSLDKLREDTRRYEKEIQELQDSKQMVEQKMEDYQRKLQAADTQIEKLRRELREQKEFKRLTTEIFCALNIRLANGAIPGHDRMDEYITALRDTLGRTGPPREQEWVQIRNFVDALSDRRRI